MVAGNLGDVADARAAAFDLDPVSDGWWPRHLELEQDGALVRPFRRVPEILTLTQPGIDAPHRFVERPARCPNVEVGHLV